MAAEAAKICPNWSALTVTVIPWLVVMARKMAPCRQGGCGGRGRKSKVVVAGDRGEAQVKVGSG